MLTSCEKRSSSGVQLKYTLDANDVVEVYRNGLSNYVRTYSNGYVLTHYNDNYFTLSFGKTVEYFSLSGFSYRLIIDDNEPQQTNEGGWKFNWS